MISNNTGRQCPARGQQRPHRGSWRAGLLLAGTLMSVPFIGTGGANAAAAEADANRPATQVVLDEITVTAQRREENLQKAGIAISALTADDLQDAGVTSQADLTRLVPAVSIYSGGQGSTQASLRGVGNLAGNTYAEQAIAFSLDGVYISRGEAIGGNFFDLDRVEVLKGPQGTLYGRNTNAGAINIITRKPEIGHLGGDVEGEVGNYGKYRAEGAVNIPTGDTAALRIAAQRVYHNGYFSDGYDDQDETGARATWLWKPNDDLSLRVGGQYSHVGGMGSTGALVPKTGDFWDGPSSASQRPRWTAVGANPVQPNGFIRVITKGANAQLDWTNPLGTLTLLPAFIQSDESALHYAAGFPVNFDQSSKSRSMEARLASPTDQRLTWILGLYYFHEEASFTLTANQTTFEAVNSFPEISTTSKAAFGQGSLKITDSLRLVLGARYTKEDKSTSGQTKVAPIQFIPVTPLTSVSNVLNASKTTWKAGFEYDVNPTSMLYLTASTGFKAGGFFASPGGTFKPETLTSYTFGSKNRFLDNRLQFNAEAYYWKYKDKQVSHLGFLPSGAIDLVTENAGDATMYGFEPELKFLVTDKDEVAASVQYEHAVYDTFIYTTPPPGPTGGTCPVAPTGKFTPGGVPIFAINCSGFKIPNTPEWVMTGSYSHTFGLSNGGNVVGNLSAHYRGPTVSGEEQTVSQHDAGYTTEDFTLTYNHPGNRWSATGYVYNLSDKNSLSSSFFFDGAPGVPTGVGSLGAITLQNAPRTYGLRVNVKF
jgi:iron complex outermembrane recepter protein